MAWGDGVSSPYPTITCHSRHECRGIRGDFDAIDANKLAYRCAYLHVANSIHHASTVGQTIIEKA
ncbi:MAG: hypothetical protein IJK42_14650 [Prevotella sp.]|nr:hypothetical protein [Prevotella sp.]